MCPGIVGFVRGRWVHWDTPQGSRVHPVSLDCKGCTLGVRPLPLVSLGCALVFVRFVWVYWCAPLVSSGSSVVAGFIRVHPRCHWVSLGSLGCALRVVGFTAVAGFIEVRPEGGRGHPGSLCSLECALVVVRFVQGYWGEPWESSGSSRIGVCRRGRRFVRGRWVHWGVPWGSSGSVGFVRMRLWVHRVHLVSLG